MSWEKFRGSLATAPVRAVRSPTAAVAVLLTPDLELLLIKRSERPHDPWSGQMALPGGRVEPGDADPLATARRETLEEIGLDLSSAELLGELDDLEPRTPTLPPVVVRPFVFGLPGLVPVTPSDEVAGHVWLGLHALRSASGRVEVVIKGKAMTVDAFRIGDPPIWGMTHRILSGLMSRIL